MAKAILEFDLSDEEDERQFRRVCTADAAYCVLWDIAQNIFRPARKHGYSCGGEILDIEKWSQETYDVVSKLEQMFFESLSEHNVNNDD